MDWDDVKEAGGCLLWIVLFVLILIVVTALPGLLDAVQHWSESLS